MQTQPTERTHDLARTRTALAPSPVAAAAGPDPDAAAVLPLALTPFPACTIAVDQDIPDSWFRDASAYYGLPPARLRRAVSLARSAFPHRSATQIKTVIDTAFIVTCRQARAA